MIHLNEICEECLFACVYLYLICKRMIVHFIVGYSIQCSLFLIQIHKKAYVQYKIVETLQVILYYSILYIA